MFFFFFSSRRRHTRCLSDWSSDVCSSDLNDGLLPLTQTAMLIRNDVAFHDYEGVAVDLSERERLVADLGAKNAMILRNHGTLAVGKNVGECFVRLYFLERACHAQVMALSAGENLNNPPQG